MTADHDEFYIGYLPSMPGGVARRVRTAVIGLAAAGALGAGLAAASLSSPGPAVWEDDAREHAGVIVCDPYPILLTPASGGGGSGGAVALVESGKIGAGARCTSLTGHAATVVGTILRRDGARVLEIGEGAADFKDAGPAPSAPPAPTDLGPLTIEGEVLDVKCFLGAMKPGDGKIHKACAIRCVAGGIPPALAVYGPDGAATPYLLADDRGGAINAEMLLFVGERVRVSGRAFRYGGAAGSAVHILRIDWASLVRV